MTVYWIWKKEILPTNKEEILKSVKDAYKFHQWMPVKVLAFKECYDKTYGEFDTIALIKFESEIDIKFKYTICLFYCENNKLIFYDMLEDTQSIVKIINLFKTYK